MEPTPENLNGEMKESYAFELADYLGEFGPTDAAGVLATRNADGYVLSDSTGNGESQQASREQLTPAAPELVSARDGGELWTGESAELPIYVFLDAWGDTRKTMTAGGFRDG